MQAMNSSLLELFVVIVSFPPSPSLILSPTTTTTTTLFEPIKATRRANDANLFKENEENFEGEPRQKE